jgi:hypothetical protein
MVITRHATVYLAALRRYAICGDILIYLWSDGWEVVGVHHRDLFGLSAHPFSNVLFSNLFLLDVGSAQLY